MAGARGRRIATGFMVLWLVFWGAGILVVLYGLGAALLAGNAAGALLMALWLVAAVFGLWQGLRKMRQLAGLAPPPARPVRDHIRRDAPPGT